MFKNCVFRPDVNTVEWIKCASVRAVRTMAQTALSLIPAAVTITDVNWAVVIDSAALSGVVSLLTSVAGIPEVGK